MLRSRVYSHSSQLVSIFGAVFRDSVSPSKLGVVLTYSISAASGLSFHLPL